MQKHIAWSFKKKWWQWLFNSLGITSVALAVLYILVHWSTLPIAVPVHFNTIGEFDGYGSRYALFLIPTIAAALYGLFHYLETTPTIYRFMTMEDDVPAKLADVIQYVVHIIKNTTMLLLSYTTISLMMSALKNTSSINMWVFGTLLGFILLPSIIGAIYLIRMQLKASE